MGNRLETKEKHKNRCMMKKIANYLSVPQRMITFVAPKEWDSGFSLPVVLPADCMKVLPKKLTSLV